MQERREREAEEKEERRKIFKEKETIKETERKRQLLANISCSDVEVTISLVAS